MKQRITFIFGTLIFCFYILNSCQISKKKQQQKELIERFSCPKIDGCVEENLIGNWIKCQSIKDVSQFVSFTITSDCTVIKNYKDGGRVKKCIRLMDGQLVFISGSLIYHRCFTVTNDTMYIDIFRPSDRNCLDVDTTYYEYFVKK